MSLTIPTALLRWDPDLDFDRWSSNDPLWGSILRSMTQIDQPFISWWWLGMWVCCWLTWYKEISVWSTKRTSPVMTLTLKQKCLSVASHSNHLMFYLLSGKPSLFWQTHRHYCLMTLGQGKKNTTKSIVTKMLFKKKNKKKSKSKQ